MIARYHPQKDHANFLRAAAKLDHGHLSIRFVLVGPGVDPNNTELLSIIEESKLVSRVHLLGQRSDIAEITAGLDVATLSSAWGEAFPNVIGEAMACGVPCVVTDIGDAASIVADTGLAVRPGDPEALAAGWARLLQLGFEGRTRLGTAARQRIVDHYRLPVITRRYQNLYSDVIRNRARRYPS
jgi:glycosyltransferase involved in cell wall biosynthesis